MRKNLIAIAVAAAVAPFAVQADTVLYGQGHVSIDSVDNGKDSNFAVSNNSSSLGVKGTQKISDSLSALYDLQWDVRVVDDQAPNLGARNQIVGLTGGFGTFAVGRHDTPVKLISRKYDLWGDTLGDSRQITNVADGGAGFDLRPGNVVAYISPKIAGGLTAILAYSADHDIAGCGTTRTPGTAIVNNDNQDCDATSASLTWDKGPFSIAVGYEEHNVSTSNESETMLRAGLGLKLGKSFRINGFYQDSENPGFVNGDGRTVYGLGLGVMLGAGELKAQGYVADELNNVKDSGATMYAVGYDYPLSKMASIYAVYTAVDNDATARLGFTRFGHTDTTGAPTANGDDPSGISLGMRVKF